MTRKDILGLFQECETFEELSDDNFADAILNYLPENFEYHYCHGVSKLVLLPKNANFVIKIPFNGFMTYDEDHSEYFYSVNDNACNDSVYYWDYCAAEVLAYRSAKSNHVEHAFCKTAFIGFINEDSAFKHPIYIQPRAQIYHEIHDFNFVYPQERSKKARKSTEDLGLYFFQPTWLTDVFEYYGEKQYKKIIQFINDYDITDLHSDNIGYIGRKPVLIDYSGWHQ